jgi:hypothetical protein
MRDSQTKESNMNLVGIATKTASAVVKSQITKAIVSTIVGGVATSMTANAYDKFVIKQPAVVGES